MATLKLVLKRKWFDMIESGEKKEEYREIKPHWIRQIMTPPSGKDKFSKSEMELTLKDIDKVFYYKGVLVGSEVTKFTFDYFASIDQRISKNIRHFDQVTFYHAYSPKRDEMTFKVDEIEINTGNKKWGAAFGEWYFVIKLGERLN